MAITVSSQPLTFVRTQRTSISHNYQFKTIVSCPQVVSSDLLSSFQHRTIEIDTKLIVVAGLK
jgi:hypothetical protein